MCSNKYLIDNILRLCYIGAVLITFMHLSAHYRLVYDLQAVYTRENPVYLALPTK